MLKQIIQDYKAAVDLKKVAARAVGSLGSLIRKGPDTAHWHVDGIDGWEPHCHNPAQIAGAYTATSGIALRRTIRAS